MKIKNITIGTIAYISFILYMMFSIIGVLWIDSIYTIIMKQVIPGLLYLINIIGTIFIFIWMSCHFFDSSYLYMEKWWNNQPLKNYIY